MDADGEHKFESKINILITGTPGTGKSCTSEQVAEKLQFRHIDVSALVKKMGFYESQDKERDCLVIDEEQLLDYLEDELADGGVVVDYHGCDFFPERWFSIVAVLRTDNEVLYPRLEKRGYKEAKIKENVQAEIMEVIADEARESYAAEVLMELPSNTIADMERNVKAICGRAVEIMRQRNGV